MTIFECFAFGQSNACSIPDNRLTAWSKRNSGLLKIQSILKNDSNFSMQLLPKALVYLEQANSVCVLVQNFSSCFTSALIAEPTTCYRFIWSNNDNGRRRRASTLYSSLREMDIARRRIWTRVGCQCGAFFYFCCVWGVSKDWSYNSNATDGHYEQHQQLKLFL